MPKLLQINVTQNWGSTGKIAEQIALKAKDQGWQTFFAHGGRFVRPTAAVSLKIGSKISDYIHYLWNSYIWGSQGLGSTRETQRLVEQIKEIKPDVIHIHNLHGYYVNYRVLFEYLNTTDIKVVWTLHDCWSFTGHCTNPTIVNCEKWKAECNSCPIRHEYPKSIRDNSNHDFRLKKNLFTSCINLHLAPVSEWQKSLLMESFLADIPCTVIHNGVDLSIFNSATSMKYSKFTILGVSSVWDKSKGLYDFYKLREILPHDEFDIILVGLKSKQVEELPAGIKGITRTESQKELLEIYSKAHIFVNPTYEDTFPTVNIEALACGTPVITYRTGGSPEALDDKTGVVVEQGDIDALAEAIRKMKEHPLSSVACRKRAEEHFDKDKCFEEYIELFNQILNEE